MRKFLALGALMAVAAFGQQLAFEVASIRPAAQITPELIQAGKLHVGMKIDAGRVDIGYASLRDLVMQAYDVKPFQVTAPDWMATERFDILAKMPEGATREQVPAMLRTLLGDRFKLVAHRENREQAIYSLEVGKNGPKFKEAPAREVSAPDAPPKPEAKPDMVLNAGDQQVRINRTGAGQGGTQTLSMSNAQTGTTKIAMGANGQMHMEMERMSMATLAQTLTPMLDRPVLDHTGLKGEFTIALDLSMSDMMQMARTAGIAGVGLPPAGGAAGGPGPAGLAASDPSGGSIFVSVQQLGLRLEKQKAPSETIIVDSMQKNPSEN